jgi:hypothetical protein
MLKMYANVVTFMRKLSLRQITLNMCGIQYYAEFERNYIDSH